MHYQKQIEIVAKLDENEAMAFAQFLKRVCLSDFQLRALNEDEAYVMQNTDSKIQRALAEQGFSPR